MLEPPTRWYYEYITPNMFLASHLARIIYAGKTQYQSVEIIETVPFGRCLILDGRTQSSEADEFVYHEALVQPALTSLPLPKSVFIAGGGEGATLREVLSHRSVEQVVLADLDREVVELCEKYLPSHHQGAFQDPRLTLVFQDAGRYLEANTTKYDLIVIDIPDPLEGGPAYLLYTQEFYRLVSQRLADGGLMVVQAGPAGLLNYHEVFTSVHYTLSTVFPTLGPYRVSIPSFGSLWSFITAGDQLNPATISAEEIDSRVASRVTRQLRFYDGTTHTGLFCLPKYLREALANEERLITRDNPLYAV
jgi:spermidine synthase